MFNYGIEYIVIKQHVFFVLKTAFLQQHIEDEMDLPWPCVSAFVCGRNVSTGILNTSH